MTRNKLVCDCNVIHEDIVDKVKCNMINTTLLYKITDFYKIMGDNTRIKILYALDQEEMCVCDISNVLNMSKSSVSHQLSTLRKCGIVKCRKVGKEVYYMLDDEHIKKVIEIGIEHIEHKEGKEINEK